MSRKEELFVGSQDTNFLQINIFTIWRHDSKTNIPLDSTQLNFTRWLVWWVCMTSRPVIKPGCSLAGRSIRHGAGIKGWKAAMATVSRFPRPNLSIRSTERRAGYNKRSSVYFGCHATVRHRRQKRKWRRRKERWEEQDVTSAASDICRTLMLTSSAGDRRHRGWGVGASFCFSGNLTW